MMKTITFSLLIGIGLILSSFSCNKEGDNEFCTKSRVTEATVFNRSGTVYFIEPYNKWGIRIDSSIASMDDTFIGFPCDLPEEIKKKGLKISFSGVLKLLNEEEIVKPTVAGGHYYYIDLMSIENKN